MTFTRKIDVIIPVFNAEKTVEVALKSILSQTFEDIRVIVIDDGSTDATAILIEYLSSLDSRVELHRKVNSGIVDSLNVALSLSESNFIARHDADDIAYPRRLELQARYLEMHTDCIAVGGAVRHIDKDGRPLGSFARLASPVDADSQWIPCREPYIIHPFLMMRRRGIVELGGYRHLPNAQDSDLCWRLSKVGRMHNLDDLLGDYRLHDSSISGRSVHNGRLSSVSSQLAGLAAFQAETQSDQIVFDRGLVQRMRDSKSLEQMVRAGTLFSSCSDHAFVAIRSAAKLLELASYRPFELTESDCVYIGSLVKKPIEYKSRSNRRELERQVAGTAARLTRDGKFREAYALLPVGLYPQAIVRYVLRLVLPYVIRNKLRLGWSGRKPGK